MKKEGVEKKYKLALLLFAVSFLFSSVVFSANGTGTNVVSPNSAVTGSSGKTFNFVFTSAETMGSGELFIDIPLDFSPAQSSPGSPGYTIISSTEGIFADVENTADSASGWTTGPNVACTNGLVADSSIKHEGLASIKCANADENINDNWRNVIVADNWSSYTKIGFWIRSSSAIPAGGLSFSYNSGTTIVVPLEAISLPAIPANTWTYVVLTFGSTNRVSIQSYGFKINTATAVDNATVWVDDFLLGPGSPSLSGGNVQMRFLQLASGKTVNITYGSGGGSSGVSVPATEGDYEFTTKTRSDGSGTLVNINDSPIIFVNAEGAPSSVEQRTARSLFTVIKFFGWAYPEARISVLERTGDQVEVIEDGLKASSQGFFDVGISGKISGNRTYGVLIKDKNGLVMPARFFNYDIGLASSIYTEIFASPTISLSATQVIPGEKLTVSGYATPGREIELEIDGNSYRKNFVADDSGFYQIDLNISTNDIGAHTVRAKQWDNTFGKQSDWSIQPIFSVTESLGLLGDLNKDSIINISDWSIFLDIWGKENGERNRIDLNRDGKVDISDFSVFIKNYKR